jgi:SAM-dependent MidA family methyltransferase
VSAVADRLKARIRESGPVSFATFMEEALYGEGGYYAGDSPVGRDFVTGSSFSPLFARSTARVLAGLAGELGGRADFLEAGFGGGEHLSGVLEATEPSLIGRVLAWDRVKRRVPPGALLLAGPEALSEARVSGLVFSYELFDALPVHRLVGTPAGPRELWVALDDEGAFVQREGELSAAGLEQLLAGVALRPGQIADLSPGWEPLYRRLARSLDRGLLVSFDYGFERERLLDERARRHGTLACYRQHRVHRDPFVDVGRQDLTAHVDFSTLLHAGESEGLHTVAFGRQARWLAAAGLFAELQGAAPKLRNEAMALLDGGGMGEEIRVLVQSRGVEAGAVLDLEVLGGGGFASP